MMIQAKKLQFIVYLISSLREQVSFSLPLKLKQKQYFTAQSAEMRARNGREGVLPAEPGIPW